MLSRPIALGGLRVASAKMAACVTSFHGKATSSAFPSAFGSGRRGNFSFIRRFSSKTTPSPHKPSAAAPGLHAQAVNGTAGSWTGSKPMRFVQRQWNNYATLLELHPVKTKVVTAALIAAIGDANCQLFIETSSDHEEEQEKTAVTRFDWKRIAIFTFLGGAIAPILHGWYGLLSQRLGGSSFQAVAKRLVLDQFGFAPTFLPVFFASLLTLEGKMLEIPAKIRNDWWPALKTNWIIWIPAQMINFSLVRGNLQVLFANVVGMFWNSYLSYISHIEVPPLPSTEDKSSMDDK